MSQYNVGQQLVQIYTGEPVEIYNIEGYTVILIGQDLTPRHATMFSVSTNYLTPKQFKAKQRADERLRQRSLAISTAVYL